MFTIDQIADLDDETVIGVVFLEWREFVKNNQNLIAYLDKNTNILKFMLENYTDKTVIKRLVSIRENNKNWKSLIGNAKKFI